MHHSIICLINVFIYLFFLNFILHEKKEFLQIYLIIRTVVVSKGINYYQFNTYMIKRNGIKCKNNIMYDSIYIYISY